MICSCRVSSNCFKLIDSRDCMALKNCWDFGLRAEPGKSRYHFAIRRSDRTTFSRKGLFEECKLFQNRMMHLNQKKKIGNWPVLRSTQWVLVPLLTPRSLFRKPRWRTCVGVIFEESYVREEVAHTWQPYRPAVKQRPGKGVAWLVFFVWYDPCYHQFCKLWQWQTWICLPSVTPNCWQRRIVWRSS